MKSNYPFLARNKQIETDKQRENIDALWNQLGSMGFVGKQSFFTGYGEDGKLQPNRPTGIMETSNGPKTVHEGEQGAVNASGNFSITPADKTPQMQPSIPDNGVGKFQGFTPAEQLGGQENLANIEKSTGMEGFQFGTPDQREEPVTNNYRPYQTRGLQRLERYAEDTSPMDTSIMNAERDRFSGKAASARGAYSQELSQAGVTGREAATEQFMLGRQIGSQENEMMQGLRKEQSDKAFAASQQLPNAAATARTEDRMQESLDFSKQQWSDTEGQRMLTDALVMDEGSWLQQHPGKTAADYKTARDEATLNQRQVSLSEQKWQDTEGQRALADTLSMDLETWLRKYPGMTANDYETGRSQTTLDQQKFASDEQKYKDSEEWKAYEAAILAGSFNTAASIYQNLTGVPIDTSEMERYQNYLIAKQNQDIISGDLTIDAQRLGVSTEQLTSFVNAVNSGADLAAANAASGLNLTPGQFNGIARDYTAAGEQQRLAIESLKTSLGSQQFNDIVDRISKGASLDQINDDLGTNLNYNDFQNMKALTPAGQQEWERSMTAASMLMQTGSPENIITAAQMYSELFPGVTFDMTQLVDDIGAERFAKGMSDMATVASTFDNWNDALTTVTGLNLAETLGLDNNAMRDLFQGLKINQIDEEWKAIENSDYYQTLLKEDPDTAQLIQDTFSAGLSGELEFDITPRYDVVDSNGDLVESFDSIADANTYLGENANAGYSIEEGKNYVYKNLTSGDTVVVNNNTGETTNIEEDTTPTINDAWDYFQESMANLPESEWPNYDKFKTEWIKAGKPNNWGYENYIAAIGEATESTVSAMVDKYKNGWPTINLSTGGDIIQSEEELNAVKAARQSFIASPESIMEVTSDNANDNFKKIGTDIFNLLSNNEQNNYSSWEEYTSKNPIYLDGYDSPFIIGSLTDGISMQLTTVRTADDVNLEGIPLISLSDGKKVWLLRDGTLSTVGKPAKFNR